VDPTQYDAFLYSKWGGLYILKDIIYDEVCGRVLLIVAKVSEEGDIFTAKHPYIPNKRVAITDLRETSVPAGIECITPSAIAGPCL
jgi:hypothetical protein